MGYWVIEQLRDLEYNETVASVQLPLNSVFFCLAEVFSHVIL